MNNNSLFYYFVCNVGSESFLKEEIKKFYPELVFSFSKKGMVTFKASKKININNVVFCLFAGEFVKKGSKDIILSHTENIIELDEFYFPINPISLEPGKVYYEMFAINEKEHYLGKFIANENQRYLKEELPLKSPSRAYLKIVEAVSKLNLKLHEDDVALEIGSSPGGATYALLLKGLEVIGVDPGEMHPECLNFKKFKHFKKSIQDFDVKCLDGKKIDWLLVDMNLAPEASLNEIEKIFNYIKKDFKGAFITLKMTKISLVSKLPFYFKIIQRMNLNPKLMTQLPSHKQEFLLFVERA